MVKMKYKNTFFKRSSGYLYSEFHFPGPFRVIKGLIVNHTEKKERKYGGLFKCFISLFILFFRLE